MTGSLDDAKLDWTARFTGRDPRAGLMGSPATPQLKLGLAGDEPAKCAQYLDAHLDVVLKPGGAPSKLDDYSPTLDGKPASIEAIVAAMLPLTMAGFTIANGSPASGPLYEGTRDQLTQLAQTRVAKLAFAKVDAAAAAFAAIPLGQGAGPAMVPRSVVLASVTDFLERVMAAQHAKAVRITEPVRLAVDALTRNLPGIIPGAALPTGITNGDPAQLAAQIVKNLPDPFPAANLADFQRASPKEMSAPNPSGSDLLAKLFSKEINAAIGLLPKKWQDTVRKGVADAIASGVSAGLGKILKSTTLDDTTQDAITSAVEAALKQKPNEPTPPPQPGPSGTPETPPENPATKEPKDVTHLPQIDLP